MKKKTSINQPTTIKFMALNLILCLVFLCSCGRDGETRGGINKMVIIEIGHYRLEPKGMCQYWAETLDEHTGKRQFYDSIGKFNIGDTVWMVKKLK